MGNPILKEYTEEQKERILLIYPSIEEYERITKFQNAQEYLRETDYTVIKAYEYSLEGKEIPEHYIEIFKKREEAREVVRQNEKTEESV